MTQPTAELSSMSSVLDDLLRRISTMAAEMSQETAEDDIASELYEVERSLSTAQRRLHKLLS